MNDDIPRRKATRYKEYDYNLPGYYFVTICVDNMKCIFGNVEHGEMKLSNVGVVVKECWNKIPLRFENVELDYYQIICME